MPSSATPFLGGKLLRTNLGDAYVDGLFRLYHGRVAAEADLVCYLHEKARAIFEAGTVKPCSLLDSRDTPDATADPAAYGGLMQTISRTHDGLRGVGRLCAAPLIIVSLVMLPGCGGSGVIPGLGMCTDATRAVIAEFPAYGNVKLEVSDGANGGCFASFTTPDPLSRVLAYYDQQLKRHGWKTHISGIAPPTTSGEAPSSIQIPTSAPPGWTAAGIGGTRDGYSYEIATEPGESPSGVYVAINVVGPND